MTAIDLFSELKLQDGAKAESSTQETQNVPAAAAWESAYQWAQWTGPSWCEDWYARSMAQALLTPGATSLSPGLSPAMFNDTFSPANISLAAAAASPTGAAYGEPWGMLGSGAIPPLPGLQAATTPLLPPGFEAATVAAPPGKAKRVSLSDALSEASASTATSPAKKEDDCDLLSLTPHYIAEEVDVEYSVTLSLSSAEECTLGLEVTEVESALGVEGIAAGLVYDWNLANADEQVKVGDSLVAVNGASGEAEKLLEACKNALERRAEASTVELRFRRKVDRQMSSLTNPAMVSEPLSVPLPAIAEAPPRLLRLSDELDLDSLTSSKNAPTLCLEGAVLPPGLPPPADKMDAVSIAQQLLRLVKGEAPAEGCGQRTPSTVDSDDGESPSRSSSGDAVEQKTARGGQSSSAASDCPPGSPSDTEAAATLLRQNAGKLLLAQILGRNPPACEEEDEEEQVTFTAKVRKSGGTRRGRRARRGKNRDKQAESSETPACASVSNE